MPEPVATTRSRKRLLIPLAFLAGITPFLAIAAVGPVKWWDEHHDRDPQWLGRYYRAVHRLGRTLRITEPLQRYEEQWRARPPRPAWVRGRKVHIVQLFQSAVERERLALEEARAHHAQCQQRHREALATVAADTQHTEFLLQHAAQTVSDCERVLAYVRTELHTAEQDLQHFDTQPR